MNANNQFLHLSLLSKKRSRDRGQNMTTNWAAMFLFENVDPGATPWGMISRAMVYCKIPMTETAAAPKTLKRTIRSNWSISLNRCTTAKKQNAQTNQ